MSSSSSPLEVFPEAYVCPITCSLMIDPVVASDGHTYERKAIESWFSSSSTATSPLTGLPVSSKALMPNHAIRSLIHDYCQGDARRQQEYSQSKMNLQTLDVPMAVMVEDKHTLRSNATKPARTKPVIVCCSRKSLNSGEGTMVGFEPTSDGTAFETAFQYDLKLTARDSFDESIGCIEKLSDNTFASGSRNGSVEMWTLKRQGGDRVVVNKTWSSKQQTGVVHLQEVTCLAAINSQLMDLVDVSTTNHPETQILASGSRDYTVKLWTNSRGEEWTCNHSEVNHRSEVFCVAGTAQGHVVSGGADWNLKLWDFNMTDEAVQVLEGHSRAVKCCVSSPDSAFTLASGSEDETVGVWDSRVGGGGMVHRIDTGSAVRCLYWQDGLLCAGGGVTLDSFTGSSSECMGGWLRFLDPRKSFATISDATIYPKPKTLRSDGDDRKLRTAHILSCMGIAPLQFAGQQAIVSGGDDKKLRVWSSSSSLLNTVPFVGRPHLSFELGNDSTIPISVDALQVFTV